MENNSTPELLNKTFHYRLRLTKDEEKVLQECANGTRFIYNWGLAQYKDHFTAYQNMPDEQKKLSKMPSRFKLMNEIPLLKKQEATRWLNGVPAQCLQQAIIDLSLSMTAFFREKKRNPLYGFPRFKKRGFRESFRFPQAVKWAPYRITLPKLGTFSYWHSYYRPLEGTIKQATVKYDGLHWYVSIVTEISRLALMPPEAPTTHVSVHKLGKEQYMKISPPDQDSLVIEVPTPLKNSMGKIVTLSRRFSRCTKDSKRWHKANKRLLKAHKKVANQRKDFLHKISTQLVNTYPALAAPLKDLKKEIMDTRNSTQQKRTHDIAWGEFIGYLKYKCLWNYKKLDIVKE